MASGANATSPPFVAERSGKQGQMPLFGNSAAEESGEHTDVVLQNANCDFIGCSPSTEVLAELQNNLLVVGIPLKALQLAGLLGRRASSSLQFVECPNQCAAESEKVSGLWSLRF